MTTPLLKPAFPPFITPSELAVMLDQAGGGGSRWTVDTVRNTLKSANALVPLPVSSASISKRAGSTRKAGKGQRYATTYELLQTHLPDIHRALVIAAPPEDLERVLAHASGDR